MIILALENIQILSPFELSFENDFNWQKHIFTISAPFIKNSDFLFELEGKDLTATNSISLFRWQGRHPQENIQTSTRFFENLHHKPIVVLRAIIHYFIDNSMVFLQMNLYF